MYRNPDEFAEYREYSEPSHEIDYSHPGYYQSAGARPPRSAQPVQPLDPYTNYADPGSYLNPAKVHPYDPYAAGQMGEYRGPTNLEGYTVDAGAEQRDASQRGTAEGGKRRKGLAGIGGTLAAIGAWLLKLKGLVFLLKFGMAGFSALISIAFYSLVFGWRFAVGLVGLLFIHEMGHAIVMKIKGIPIGGMIFIPMFGAAVTMRQMPQNARDEAEVGIAGPIAGALSASFCLFMAYQYQAQPIWAALAYFGFFINLINLVPIVPFDGGRVLAAIDRRVWVLGFLALLGFQIWSWLHGDFNLWLLLFVFMAATQLWSRGLRSNNAQGKAYYDVPVMTRIVLSLLYFGLVGVLVLGMTVAHSLLPVP